MNTTPSPIAQQEGFSINELAAANALITMPPMITAWAQVQK